MSPALHPASSLGPATAAANRRAKSTARRSRRLETRLGFERCEPRHLMASDTGRMAVGMNLENVVDWSPAWTFTDAFQASRSWISQAYNTATGEMTWDIGQTRPLRVDATGNVVALDSWTNAAGQTMRQMAGTLMFRDLEEPIPAASIGLNGRARVSSASASMPRRSRPAARPRGHPSRISR